jgi:hypothetical protein
MNGAMSRQNNSVNAGAIAASQDSAKVSWVSYTINRN